MFGVCCYGTHREKQQRRTARRKQKFILKKMVLYIYGEQFVWKADGFKSQFSVYKLTF